MSKLKELGKAKRKLLTDRKQREVAVKRFLGETKPEYSVRVVMSPLIASVVL